MSPSFTLVCDVSECGKHRVLAVMPSDASLRPFFAVFKNDAKGLKFARDISTRVANDMAFAGAEVKPCYGCDVVND